MKLPPRDLWLAAIVGLAAQPVFSAVVWDESSNGDLSGTYSSPTALSLSVGTNSVLISKLAVADVDYFKFTLSAGQSLTSLTLTSYTSTDGTSFIGVVQGIAFAEDAANTSAAELFGYTHIGSVPGNVGTDILDNIGTGAGAQGFTPPLPAGSYSFWTQQAGAVATSYQLDFLVIPEPSTVALAAGFVTLVAAGVVRGRRSRQLSRAV